MTQDLGPDLPLLTISDVCYTLSVNLPDAADLAPLQSVWGVLSMVLRTRRVRGARRPRDLLSHTRPSRRVGLRGEQRGARSEASPRK
jgi:hypothetical protein